MTNFMCGFVVFAATITASLQKPSLSYCEFGLCDELAHQVCCGENKCCTNSVNLGYFWAGALILLAIIIAFLVRFRRNRYDFYTNVPTDNELG